MIVLDASVVIAHFDVADGSHERATALLAEYAGDTFLMSVVTRAEVLVRPARAGALAQVESALEQLSVVTTGLDGDAAAALARLRSETNLRLPDCCVLFEAERASADIATFNARLAAVAVGRGRRVIA